MYDYCNRINAGGTARVLADYGYVIEYDAVSVFREAQYVQDAALAPPSSCTCPACQQLTTPDSSWGAALARAEEWAQRNDRPSPPSPTGDSFVSTTFT
jgi:hypothetical protein